MKIPWWLSLLPLPCGYTWVQCGRLSELERNERASMEEARRRDRLECAEPLDSGHDAVETLIREARRLLPPAIPITGNTAVLRSLEQDLRHATIALRTATHLLEEHAAVTGSCSRCGRPTAANRYVCDSCAAEMHCVRH